jgi:TonB family protein
MTLPRLDGHPVLLLFVAALISAAAAADPDTMDTCAPGSSMPCACSDGSTGLKTCTQEKHFAACVCGQSGARRHGSMNDATPENVKGMQDPKVLAGVFRSRRGAPLACYELALRENPGIAGTIQVRFTLRHTGAVAGVAVEGYGIGDPKLTACLLKILRTWRFPAPPDGATVSFSYPFNFEVAR